MKDYNRTASECNVASAARLGVGPLSVAPQAPIPAAVSALYGQINDAHSAIARLEERLGPVLEQPMAVPGGVNGKVDRGPTCEHHGALLELLHLAEALGTRLTLINNRLAL